MVKLRIERADRFDATNPEVDADYDPPDLKTLPGAHAHTMVAVPVGKTLNENLEFRLYYAPVWRRFRPHGYLALYTDMSIVAIGRVNRVVLADLNAGDLVLPEPGAPLSDSEGERILNAMESAASLGWNIKKDRNFWLFDRLVRTDFRKASPSGMANKRYFDLRQELGLGPDEPLPDIEDIASGLNGKTWT